MSRYKLKLILTLSLSALILGYWGFREPHQAVTDLRDQRLLDEEVDGYLLKARMVEFDSTGEPRRILTAARIDHYPQRDLTLAASPEITLMRKDGNPLHVTARQGLLRHGDNQIELQDEVVVADLDTPRYRLETPSLTLYPDRDYAETDAPVHIFHLSGETRAIGMRMFLDQDRVQLLQRVRGIHEPN